eukprot:TRINITY_DN112882_c0_g1_i1.p1 TRINITY_DN112882_c0_g1~~TRINITY_DN112882_c0_g1_i1.p1  ORF type:complete len:874 (-),score=164.17 TRINITY_DN112882_c0_g1_i1:891-3512(-)
MRPDLQALFGQCAPPGLPALDDESLDAVSLSLSEPAATRWNRLAFDFRLPRADSYAKPEQSVASPVHRVGDCCVRLNVYPCGYQGRWDAIAATLQCWPYCLTSSSAARDLELMANCRISVLHAWDPEHTHLEEGTCTFSEGKSCYCARLIEGKSWNDIRAAGWLTAGGDLVFRVNIEGELTVPASVQRPMEYCAEGVLRTMWLDRQFSDMLMVADGGEEIPCHRSVVASASPVFRRMLLCTMREGHLKRVTMHEASAKDVTTLLEYVYTGCISEGIDYVSLLSLLRLADMYQLSSLMDICAGRLGPLISQDNIADILRCLSVRQQGSPSLDAIARMVMEMVKSDNRLLYALCSDVPRSRHDKLYAQVMEKVAAVKRRSMDSAGNVDPAVRGSTSSRSLLTSSLLGGRGLDPALDSRVVRPPRTEMYFQRDGGNADGFNDFNDSESLFSAASSHISGRRHLGRNLRNPVDCQPAVAEADGHDIMVAQPAVSSREEALPTSPPLIVQPSGEVVFTAAGVAAPPSVTGDFQEVVQHAPGDRSDDALSRRDEESPRSQWMQTGHGRWSSQTLENEEAADCVAAPGFGDGGPVAAASAAAVLVAGNGSAASQEGVEASTDEETSRAVKGYTLPTPGERGADASSAATPPEATAGVEVGATADAAAAAVMVSVLCFDRHSQRFSEALAASAIGRQLEREAVDILPTWANGAKVLLRGVDEGLLRAQGVDPAALRPWHVLVLESEEERVAEALRVFKFKERPRVRQGVSRRVAMKLDATGDVDPCSSLPMCSSERGAARTTQPSARTGEVHPGTDGQNAFERGSRGGEALRGFLPRQDFVVQNTFVHFPEDEAAPSERSTYTCPPALARRHVQRLQVAKH